ncbi:MAG: lactonase family protein [Lachnospiraceae bacterium]|nr:lactonase family protein [Lachnospiraceae bacterium]
MGETAEKKYGYEYEEGAQYVAYVSSYTISQKEKYGIRVYDVDLENGLLHEKDRVKITNSSYVTISHARRFLYSITDAGIESFRIGKGGRLEFLNRASINGMRGSHVSTDYEDKFLFVASYHDGKITVLRVNEDGSVGDICDEKYLKGLGSIAERNFRPHVQCVKMTRDNKYLCAADLGMDHINVYTLNHDTGKIKQCAILHSEMESAPRHIKFSRDGHYMYVVHELKNIIDVYYYLGGDGAPDFQKIQTISTLSDYHGSASAASALNFSTDHRYLVSSNAGDNTVVVYKINEKDGKLTMLFCLPVSGEYPKDAALFPDNRHLVSLNHESNTMTFFTVDLRKKLMVMHGKEIEIDKPNCIIFHKLLPDQL